MDYTLIALVAAAGQYLGLTRVEAVYVSTTRQVAEIRVWYRVGRPEQPVSRRAWLADVYVVTDPALN